ncbi:hypothetical protein AAFF_G00405440 [Aldrovandia affinis]|uniref:Uncharacterized protein n=1 Tax=Aldrovandia affinis TaxID=143900 RepID=A0AAD7SC93_9TELE|nr:hypothetical protein AAFF_G00405440 [Aldrovandia affinis]
MSHELEKVTLEVERPLQQDHATSVFSSLFSGPVTSERFGRYLPRADTMPDDAVSEVVKLLLAQETLVHVELQTCVLHSSSVLRVRCSLLLCSSGVSPYTRMSSIIHRHYILLSEEL